MWRIYLPYQKNCIALHETFKKTYMQTLSSITNYRHSNVFVQQAKIKKAIADLMLIRAQQAYANRIFISYQDIQAELQKAQKLLDTTEKKIREIEVNTEVFGAQISEVLPPKSRYQLRTDGAHFVIYDFVLNKPFGHSHKSFARASSHLTFLRKNGYI